MENNSYILIFKNRAVKQLKRKNFANDQRLPFYQALTKIANETVQSLDNQNDKNDIMQFVKRFISNMSRDETLTPQNALKSFEDEVDNNQHLIATTEKNINKLSPKEQQELNNKLFKAVVSGEINAVNEHLNHGANINALDGHANTLLIRAIMNDQTETAKFLIENGVDINKPNCWNETALIRAINEMNSEIALLLIENGADVNPLDYPNTPLSCAIDKKQPEIAKHLIENGADLNALNMIGEPILISAIENKQTDIAKSLIDKGVSLNQVDICKNTPLIKAIYNNQSEIAKLLIEKKCFS